MKKITLSSLLLLFSIAVLAQIQTVGIEEFEKLLYSTKAEQLIDVRTSKEFVKYHIQSAKNIDFRSSGFRKEIEKLDKTKRTIPKTEIYYGFCRKEIEDWSTSIIIHNNE